MGTIRTRRENSIAQRVSDRSPKGAVAGKTAKIPQLHCRMPAWAPGAMLSPSPAVNPFLDSLMGGESMSGGHMLSPPARTFREGRSLSAAKAWHPARVVRSCPGRGRIKNSVDFGAAGVKIYAAPLSARLDLWDNSPRITRRGRFIPQILCQQ
jgi:hypothetical protein